ncbi:TadE/TadG family type IV pilus assembly protein [Yoonia sp.]|uniref:TadE/TadG family type IV pilus assembly protein n=1 Tax=Yoonia sp. TaxID=2212373 RepID=UPI0039756568
MKSFLNRFLKDESGTSSIEIVLVFPVFFGFFLMTYESGILSSRQVMLEHGVDVTVRNVRIGVIDETDSDLLRAALRTGICDSARILPDCENQLEIEMIQRDPRVAWVPLSDDVQCVDRGDLTAPYTGTLDSTGNNELMFLRACIRIDPILPTSNLGKALIAGNAGDTAAGDSYALVATSAFVVEPFRNE